MHNQQNTEQIDYKMENVSCIVSMPWYESQISGDFWKIWKRLSCYIFDQGDPACG